MRRFVTNAFGLLLLTMAVTQLIGPLSLQHALFNHGLPNLTPFPLSLIIITLEVAGVIGILLMDSTNIYKQTFIKLGIAAGVVWLLLFIHMLIRGMDTLNTGLLGDSIKIPFGWAYFIIIAILLWLGVAAYRYQDPDA